MNTDGNHGLLEKPMVATGKTHARCEIGMHDKIRSGAASQQSAGCLVENGRAKNFAESLTSD